MHTRLWLFAKTEKNGEGVINMCVVFVYLRKEKEKKRDEMKISLKIITEISHCQNWVIEVQKVKKRNEDNVTI